MSLAYNNYLDEHIANVGNAYEWLHEYLPEIFEEIEGDIDVGCLIKHHDESKCDMEEYNPYDCYFYGGTRTQRVVDDFQYAWLHHIHNNPHHWQHYVLINDEPGEGIVALDMPKQHIIEMICDWWSFSWSKGHLGEIFAWYHTHRKHMRLSDKTRKTVEDILGKMLTKLDELEEGEEE